MLLHDVVVKSLITK